MFRLYGALIGLSLIWGLSFVFMKWLLPSAGIWGIVFFRCLAGTIILLPFLWWKRREVKEKLPWKALIIVGIFNCGLAWGLISLSETEINSTTASILNATTPIWTGLIGFILFSYRLTRRQWIGILIGFFGILVLMDFQFGQIFGRGFVGIGTMLVACICYGLAGQLTKRFLSEVSVLTITTFTLLTGAIIGLIGMLITEPFKSDLLIHPLPILAIVGLGCFGSGLGQLIYFYINKNGGPELAATVTYLIPATAMVWGYVLLGETITPNVVIGLLIIFAGVYLSSRKSKGKTPYATLVSNKQN
ncbi:DMT family transporter [Priestia megaterium]|uniref:DMT family transporter n=1 Tax=Priestia megaterium TaxID=1404 RepID=UPI001EDA09E2|nr:DMT family transporter [Priestia megaterium]MDH3157106.1 DMT family transporter [Priestia megaterium]MED4112493.1 DMT family transporter [Priestia megaterium]UKJ79283.1 DMT family transporter [Priestia megaterium]